MRHVQRVPHEIEVAAERRPTEGDLRQAADQPGTHRPRDRAPPSGQKSPRREDQDDHDQSDDEEDLGDARNPPRCASGEQPPGPAQDRIRGVLAGSELNTANEPKDQKDAPQSLLRLPDADQPAEQKQRSRDDRERGQARIGGHGQTDRGEGQGRPDQGDAREGEAPYQYAP